MLAAAQQPDLTSYLHCSSTASIQHSFGKVKALVLSYWNLWFISDTLKTTRMASSVLCEACDAIFDWVWSQDEDYELSDTLKGPEWISSGSSCSLCTIFSYVLNPTLSKIVSERNGKVCAYRVDTPYRGMPVQLLAVKPNGQDFRDRPTLLNVDVVFKRLDATDKGESWHD